MNLLEKAQIQALLNVDDPAKKRRRRDAFDILGMALAAVEPGAAIHNALSYDPATQILQANDRTYNLSEVERVFLVGAGKAGAPMAAAVRELLGDRLTGGIVTVKYGYGSDIGNAKLQIREAGHPVLDENGIAATAEITALLENTTERDLVIGVISGGGSALLEQPVPGVTLADLQALTSALLACGATINQLNIIRKHLSRVKGGQLARLAQRAQMLNLLLSDVVGSPLDIIASGPTVPDTSTYAHAWQILENFGLPDKIPVSIAAHLQKGVAGEIPETPRADDPLFERVQNLVVGDNRVAANAALAKAAELGYNPLLLSTFIEGEARDVARWYAAIAREVLFSGHPVRRPAAIIAGGETTVTLRGDGKGGRNQEMALAAALALDGLPDVLIVPFATDGSDGPTDAAGALAEGDTVSRAKVVGLDPQAFLERNDAYNFFAKSGDLVITEPTNTNVNDLTLILVGALTS
jgi:glycerate 2-kinase